VFAILIELSFKLILANFSRISQLITSSPIYIINLFNRFSIKIDALETAGAEQYGLMLILSNYFYRTLNIS